MNMYAHLIRPVLFRCDPEWVHDRVIQAAARVGFLTPLNAVLGRRCSLREPVLETAIAGLRFGNPVGLAAGFDKSGRAVRVLSSLGFGHLEIGSVSSEPSAGNPKPRLWRLPEDRAILVHYGLPNDGAEAVARRLAGLDLPVPLGINIVNTNRGVDAPPDSEADIILDYVRSVRLLKDRADYLHLNLSCPNTSDGRDFFAERGRLPALLHELAGLNIRCPVFLKIPPAGGPAYIDQVLSAAESAAFISGFAFNLPPGRPEGLKTPLPGIESLPGAVSGRPAEARMNAAISELYRRMDRQRYRIIGIGGVFSAEDAYRKIRLGASLVQLMTALIYEGPGVVRRINHGLYQLLRRDGFRNVAEAVGTAHSRS